MFKATSSVVNHLLDYASEGSKFVFGDKLGAQNDQFGVVFAFQVLPIVIFIASLFAILYYLGIMPFFVRLMASVMQRVMAPAARGIDERCGQHFHGPDRSASHHPPLHREHDPERTVYHHDQRYGARFRSRDGCLRGHRVHVEILPPGAPAVISDGACHLDACQDPDARGWYSATAGGVKIEVEKPGVNLIDAAARGAGDGLQLALNIGGMLIAFIGLIALVNGTYWPCIKPACYGMDAGFASGHSWADFRLSHGYCVKYSDCATIGNLLGTRMILNEFVAFVDLGKIGSDTDPKSFVITTFALCGFANRVLWRSRSVASVGWPPAASPTWQKLGLKATERWGPWPTSCRRVLPECFYG